MNLRKTNRLLKRLQEVQKNNPFLRGLPKGDYQNDIPKLKEFLSRPEAELHSKNHTYSSLSEKELYFMANLTEKETEIKDVVIWVGANPHYYRHRIKVSNTLDYSGNNCFTITIPELNILGEVNKEMITMEKLTQIKDFVKLNMETIIDYSNFKLSTADFLAKLKKQLL